MRTRRSIHAPHGSTKPSVLAAWGFQEGDEQDSESSDSGAIPNTGKLGIIADPLLHARDAHIHGRAILLPVRLSLPTGSKR
jgi:hypothetical protein